MALLYRPFDIAVGDVFAAVGCFYRELRVTAVLKRASAAAG